MWKKVLTDVCNEFSSQCFSQTGRSTSSGNTMMKFWIICVTDITQNVVTNITQNVVTLFWPVRWRR